LSRAPCARGTLFDLPHVVAGAAAALAHFEVASRIDLVSGSFFESIPSGGDTYLLKHILHDWDDDDACLAILATVRRALAAEARLVMVEMLLDPRGGRPLASLLDLNMLVMQGGRERTLAEFTDLFRRADLSLSAHRDTSSPFTVLEARACESYTVALGQVG
jgi:hypothetical protein